MTMELGGAPGQITSGRTALGIELGSSRVKATLTGPDHQVLATGAFDWENQLVNGLWTYSLDQVWEALRGCYQSLAGNVRQRYGVSLTRVGGIGLSAMMHGYLAFDSEDELLVPFRTWRNTNTARAAAELSQRLGQNMPQRWSAAHLYQAMLDGEPHVQHLAYLTTLAGYVHWQLTGRKVVGVGDASGMLPIDSGLTDWDAAAVATFDVLAVERGMPWRLADLLPTVLSAGVEAGVLTEAGARLLDPSGQLAPGVPLCPPEGDAGTGMVATGAVAPRSGNVSVGTSIFAMIVLERPLGAAHEEIDLVTTPSGEPVAMVHCNNGASELDAWCSLLGQFAVALGIDATPDAVFAAALGAAVDGDPAAGGLVAFNYLAGEPITHLTAGRPLFVREPDSQFTLANFMRAQVFAVFATLRLGMDVLAAEGVAVDSMFAHGGLFRTPGAAQRLLAAALGTPVSVAVTAGEGGPWGAAVLASYMGAVQAGDDRSLAQYLAQSVFAASDAVTAQPSGQDVVGFNQFLARFVAALPAMRAATGEA